jgi:hypothetical protein
VIGRAKMMMVGVLAVAVVVTLIAGLLAGRPKT